FVEDVEALHPGGNAAGAIDVGTIADDDVVAVGAGEEVETGSAARRAAGDFARADARDRVVAANVRARRIHGGLQLSVGRVAEDDVAAEAGLDLVAAGAADYHVLAAGAGNGVDAAVDMPHRQAVLRYIEDVEALDPGGDAARAIDLAAVADDHVVAVGAGKEV